MAEKKGMKRVLGVFLGLTITLSCLALPAAAAEGGLFPAVKAYEGFEDVAESDWFAPYVRLCVETGLMNGVGGGRFDPQGQVTYAQAATLAARIHSARNGGEGTLEKAPENWGNLTVELENGTVLEFTSGQYRLHPVPMSAVLGASVEGEQLKAMEWLGDHEDATGTITAHLDPELGPYPCQVYWNTRDETSGALRFCCPPDATEEERAVFGQMEGTLGLYVRPEAGDWFRDTEYCLEKAGLTKNWALRPSEPGKSIPRADFVTDLDVVSEGILEPINEIEDYPDSGTANQSERTQVLRLYNAGILTGKDDYGTFDAGGTLTRAECAAMLARLVRPGLRLKFQPKTAPEKYGYTLTYLMDDPMESHMVTAPVLPIMTQDGKDNGILTLDGTLLPFPGDGKAPVSMSPQGDYYFMSFWFTEADGGRVEKGGLIDASGTFVVPLTAGCYRARPVEGGGYLSQTGDTENGVVTLWDETGHGAELGSMDWYEADERYPWPLLSQWEDVERWGAGYVDGAGHSVSEEFAWVGRLTADGRGFVGKDGKIYRIQFFEK